MEIRKVIENLQNGEGIKLIYDTYIDFYNKDIIRYINIYNRINKENFTIKDVVDIGNKYGTLFLYLKNKDVIEVKGRYSKGDHKKAKGISTY